MQKFIFHLRPNLITLLMDLTTFFKGVWMNIEDMWHFCSWAYRISTCGINWWKFSRLIEKALSWSQWRRTLASWTPTWSLFHVSIISSKHFIKSSLCSNTFEIILLWKFVCTDQGILMATQSSRNDTLCGEQEKNTENAFRFAKKTHTSDQDWVWGHSNEHNEHWDMLLLLSSEHL